jgi:hypothetical protein
MIAWVFDVEAVANGDSEFEQWFLNWATGKSIYLVTDKDRAEVARIVHPEIYARADILFYCMGNTIISRNEITNLNHFKLTEEEYNWLSNLGPVSIKGGCVSVKYKDATLDTIKEFNNKFNRLEAFISKSNIVVVRRGAHTRIPFIMVQQLPKIDSIIFLGSKFEEGEIFKPFFDICKKCANTIIKSSNVIETRQELEKL